jgi:hypothetical protein
MLDDSSRLASVKFVGRDNAAGAEPTTADIQANNAANTVTFRINLAAEGMNTYTGAAGGAGVIDCDDANANSPQELVDIINGVGTGMPAPTAGRGAGGYNDRWRAAIADFPPLWAIGGTDLLNDGAVRSALLGVRSTGIGIYGDTTNLANDDIWCGIGTEDALLEGGGIVAPDYFEDYPGVTGITGFASNIADRSRQVAKQNDDSVVVAAWTPVITHFAIWSTWVGNDAVVEIWDATQNPATGVPLYTEAYGAGTGLSAVYTGQPGSAQLVGRPGVPLFVRAYSTGGGAITANQGLTVGGYYELSLRG